MNFKTKLMIIALIPTLFAFSGCGNDGEETFSPTVVDTAPPAVPYGLTGKCTDTGVQLQWDPNTTDADFIGFKVYRVINSRMLELTFEPIMKSYFNDRMPIIGEINEYRVTSLDYNNNESGHSVISIQVYEPEEDSFWISE